ncbi:metabotropic glutamate receptor 7-like [Clytia hemisphaerica]|uniref:metabotropic glutamate receptor 7-like n=1 Tax=Clytia hemisphaerica TaxID=252671 RepID=UPI0034D4207D
MVEMSWRRIKEVLPIAIVVIIGVFQYVGNVQSVKFIDNDTFPITGLVSIRNDRYGRVSKTGTIMIEALRFAIRQVNQKNRKFLHGYRFGFNRFHDISDTKVYEISDIVKDLFLEDYLFLVGPHSSETSYVTDLLSVPFGISVISYGATFSDFPRVSGESSYTYRTVPSNTFRIQALVDVVKTLRWNYVSIISSYGYDGERDARYFTQEIIKMKICLGNIYDLPRNTNQQRYKDILEAVDEDESARVLLLFTNIKDSMNILKAVTKLKLEKRFLLFCVLGCLHYDEVIRGNEEAALGMLSLDLYNYPNSQFEEYFKALTPGKRNKSYFRNFWEQHFNCVLNASAPNKFKRPTCTGNEKMTDVEFLKDVSTHTIISAVYAFACATRSIVQKYCGVNHEGGSKTCSQGLYPSSTEKYFEKVFESLKNVTFNDGTLDLHRAFANVNYNATDFGDFKDISKYVRYDVFYYGNENKNILIGQWKKRRVRNRKRGFSSTTGSSLSNFFLGVQENDERFKSSFNLMNSHIVKNLTNIVCSPPCKPGHYRVPYANFAKRSCCFTCSPCPEHHISINGTCSQCAMTEKQVNNQCVMLPQIWIGVLSDIPSIVFSFLSVLGAISVVFVALIFVRFNDHKLVRASGRDLFYIMLFGIFLTFIIPFTVLTKPSSAACVARGILPGLAFLTCYAPLFLKTNRIYRIFLHGKRTAQPPNLISPQSQIVILCGITAVQILLSSVFFASKTPNPELEVNPERTRILLKCKGDSSPILMLLNLIISVVFMVSCTFLAFKTRHFPKNFNEAKDIGVTLYITCVIWSVFLPAFFLTVPWRLEFVREYLMSGLAIVLGYTTLFGLFGRKLKILFTGDKADDSATPKEHKNVCNSVVSRFTSIRHRIYSETPSNHTHNNGVKFKMILNDSKSECSSENNNDCESTNCRTDVDTAIESVVETTET